MNKLVLLINEPRICAGCQFCESEYPVVVYMYKVQGYFNIDWFSIKELEK